MEAFRALTGHASPKGTIAQNLRAFSGSTANFGPVGSSDSSVRDGMTSERARSTSLRLQKVIALEQESNFSAIQDVIQFSSATYFCMEGEGHLRAEVVRLGDAVNEATVEYFTVDGSAVAGRKYEATKGLLRFLPGERQQTIYVRILEDDLFDTTLEFQLVLHIARGAVLGKYLRSCQIMIMDDDAFPTNKYQELLKAGMAAQVPYWSLLCEFFKMALQGRGIRFGFGVILLIDQLCNLKFVWGIILTNYLVDEVLKPPPGQEPPENADFHVYAVLGLSLLPHPLLIFLERQKAFRRLNGRVIGLLQQNLLRKFLNYDESSRALVSSSDLTMAITRDVPELVDQGFDCIFGVFQQAGLLLIFVGLQVKVLGTALWLSLVLFFGCPVLTFLFLLARQRTTNKLRDDAFRCQTDIVGFIQQAVNCYRLINDYWQRPQAVQMFGAKVNDCNSSKLACKVWDITSEHFAPYITMWLCSIYVLISYQKVLDGGPIGEFLAGVAIWRGIGHSFKSIFENIRSGQQVISPLQNVVYYMNLSVDTLDRMKHNRRVLENARQKLHLAQQLLDTQQGQAISHQLSSGLGDKSVFATDLMQIHCNHVTFGYANAQASKLKPPPHVLEDCSFVIPQGRLVCVTGPRGGGKKTLLSLLGDVIRPHSEDGSPADLFVPPHLRVLHVGWEPDIFSDLDIFENLCFGPAVGSDHDPKRVLAICRRLGMSHEILDLIDHFAQEHKHNAWTSEDGALRNFRHHPQIERRHTCSEASGTAWSVAKRMAKEIMQNDAKLLTQTDRCLIHLARAFIMNPDVLIMHKPLAQLDELQKRHVLDLMREFVDLRGLEKPPEEWQTRCKRTCIFSVADMKGTDVSDAVLHVAEGKISEVNANDLENLRQFARRLFEAMDLDCDNLVSRGEFESAVRNAPWASELLGVSGAHTDQHIEEIFDLLDRKKKGEVDFDELVQFLRLRFDANLPHVLEVLHSLGNASLPTTSPKRVATRCHSWPPALGKLSTESLVPVRDNRVALRKDFTFSEKIFNPWQIPEVAIEMPIPVSKLHPLLVEP